MKDKQINLAAQIMGREGQKVLKAKLGSDYNSYFKELNKKSQAVRTNLTKRLSTACNKKPLAR